MASFGKQAKCGTCGRTGDSLEMVTARGYTYHKPCFKCFHDGCTGLSPTNCMVLSGTDGTLYCYRHFSEEMNRHLSSRTGDTCSVCLKTVLALEKMKVDSGTFHKSCFRCSYEGCVSMSPSDYIVHHGVYYCQRHHDEALEEGNFKTPGYYQLYDWSNPASFSGSAAQNH